MCLNSRCERAECDSISVHTHEHIQNWIVAAVSRAFDANAWIWILAWHESQSEGYYIHRCMKRTERPPKCVYSETKKLGFHFITRTAPYEQSSSRISKQLLSFEYFRSRFQVLAYDMYRSNAFVPPRPFLCNIHGLWYICMDWILHAAQRFVLCIQHSAFGYSQRNEWRVVAWRYSSTQYGRGDWSIEAIPMSWRIYNGHAMAAAAAAALFAAI